jgi:hypothetical protein
MNYQEVVQKAHAELRQANITDVHALRALDILADALPVIPNPSDVVVVGWDNE